MPGCVDNRPPPSRAADLQQTELSPPRSRRHRLQPHQRLRVPLSRLLRLHARGPEHQAGLGGPGCSPTACCEQVWGSMEIPPSAVSRRYDGQRAAWRATPCSIAGRLHHRRRPHSPSGRHPGSPASSRHAGRSPGSWPGVRQQRGGTQRGRSASRADGATGCCIVGVRLAVGRGGPPTARDPHLPSSFVRRAPRRRVPDGVAPRQRLPQGLRGIGAPVSSINFFSAAARSPTRWSSAFRVPDRSRCSPARRCTSSSTCSAPSPGSARRAAIVGSLPITVDRV